MFAHEDAVPYHIYWEVLNAKHFGVPQNRERVFIVGVRDDYDNSFRFPVGFPLEKRLKDILEDEVDEKCYLSEKMIDYLTNNSELQKNSETRRGRVGNKVAQTLDTSCNQAVIRAIRGRNPENPKSRESGLETKQMLELNHNGTSNALTTVQKDNVVVQLNQSKESGGNQPYKQNRIFDGAALSPTLDTECGRPGYLFKHSIRKLTPRECFRLMDFSDSFKFVVSNTQLYKQAGNSIVVAVLAAIIEMMNLK